MIYIYDARYNLKKETTWDMLEGITGSNKKTLQTLKSRKLKIPKLKHCYVIDETTPKSQLRIWYEKVVYEHEEWKSLDDSYKVSNYGRVKKMTYLKHPDGKLFLPWIRKHKGKDKWMCVRIHGKETEIHKLVALLFLKNTHGYECVWHKNGLLYDNHYKNLEYIDRKTLGKKTVATNRGYKSIVAIDNDTGEIIDWFNNSREVEKKLYVNRQSVLNNLNGKTQKVAGGKYSFFWED